MLSSSSSLVVAEFSGARIFSLCIYRSVGKYVWTFLWSLVEPDKRSSDPIYMAVVERKLVGARDQCLLAT